MSNETFIQIPRDTEAELRRTLERMVEEISILKAKVSELEDVNEG